MYIITLPWGLHLYPIQKSYNQTRLGLEFQIEQNLCTKQTLITMKNIKSSSTTDRYTAMSRSTTPCAFLHDHRQATSHSHRQPSTPVIGTNPSPLLDLAISCRFPIGTNPHRQLFCRLAATFLLAIYTSLTLDTRPKIRVQKRCQHKHTVIGDRYSP